MNSQNDVCMSLAVSSLLPLVCEYAYTFYHSEKYTILWYVDWGKNAIAHTIARLLRQNHY